MSVFAVAPSVQWSERDATLHTKASVDVSTAHAGHFRWGEANSVVEITGGKEELKQKFFKSDDDTYLDTLILKDYFRYASSAFVTRVIGPAAINATTTGQPAVLVDNKDTFETSNFPATTTVIGRYAGSLGNSIAFSAVDATDFADWEYGPAFDMIPTGDEMSAVVLDRTGEILGGSGELHQSQRLRLFGNSSAAGNLVVDGQNLAMTNGGTPWANVNTFVTAIEGLSTVRNGSGRLVSHTAGVLQVEEIQLAGTQGGANQINAIIGGVTFTIAANATAAQARTALLTAFGTGGSTEFDTIVAKNGTTDTIVCTYEVHGPNTPSTPSAIGDNITATTTVVTAGIQGEITVDYERAVIGKLDHTVTGTMIGHEGTVLVDGTHGQIIEKFGLLSETVGARRSDGSNAYFFDVINDTSNWVYVPSATTLPTGMIALSGGVDDYSLARESGLQLFSNAETYDFNTILGVGSVGEQQTSIDVAIARRDCVSFVSPPIDAVVNNRGRETESIVAWRESLGRDSSYFFMDDNWALVWDDDSLKVRWIPTCGGTAGLYARTIQAVGPWKSPAFHNRGKYLNYRRMAWSATSTQRKVLFNQNSVNSIVTFPKEGFILYGDKTGLTRPSAFDRLPVRGTFIMMEKNIATTSKYILGENNDEYTRALFSNTVRPYIRNLEDQNAIIQGKVKCDEDNNTGQVIASNQIVMGIWIKPQYSINWVYLDFGALSPDMEFSELEDGGGIVTV